MAGGNLPFGFAPSGEMTSYTPTLRDRATDWFRRMLFSDDRAGQGRAERVMDVAAFTPFGFGVDMYDAGREAGMGNYGGAALTLGMAGMPGPSPKKIRAFHGSPHDFDRFSLDKIGTGEGAQAYGHGLYFAENEGVAKGHRDALSGNKYDTGYPNVDAVLNGGAFQGDWAGFAKKHPGLAAEIEAAGKAKPIGSAGRMYEVEIDADPDAFLDWDKPLSEQPEAVRSAFSAVDKRVNSRGDIYTPGTYEDAGDWVKHFQNAVGADEARNRIKAAGIPGIKYLDAGSRGAGDGTRNYVVFDDRLISIVRKYGIAGASAMLGYNILDGMDPAQADELKRIEGNQ